MIRHAVLIFSSDTLAAALIGAAVELAELTPQFPQEGESVRAALMRVRPKLVLIDCDHKESCSDEFIGPALMTGARILLFRSPHPQRDVGAFSSRLGLHVIDMPLKPESFMRLLTQALAQ